MCSSITKESLYDYLKSWESFEKEIIEEAEAYRVIFVSGDKSVIVTIPYEVGEFFLDFFKDSNTYYSDWYEVMDDSVENIMDYTLNVVKRYLESETRIIDRGWWIFKSSELQYKFENGWLNVLQP